jgi:DNA-binding NarL/FixJ family response regulator
MKRTVLLVEDEPDTREVLCRALEREQLRCLVAADAASALHLAKSAGPFDVVVTDVVMGKDDHAGLRLLSDLREIGVRAPVIVITAFADVHKVKVALNEGAAHLLEKPFRARELVDAIDRVCRRVDDGAGHASATMDEVFARARLTDKERAVARHLLEGLTANEIAARENNSEKTIRQHVTQIYAKCGVVNRTDLFRKVYARQGG